MPMMDVPSGTIHTFDGIAIRIRSIEPDDWKALQRFHTTLSMDTVIRRTFDAQPMLSDQRAHYFCDVDGYDRVAMVAEDPEHPGELIGVVRFDREPGTFEAEYAAVITDRWQGQGIGLALTALLIEVARQRNIDMLFAYVQPDNWKMLTLLRNLGLSERIVHEDDVERVEICIQKRVACAERPAG